MWIFSVGLENALRIRDKCRLFTRKWHVIEQSPMWQNGIWLVEYNSSMWKIAQCSCSAMIGYVLIGLWMLFSWYVMKCKLFGLCIWTLKYYFLHTWHQSQWSPGIISTARKLHLTFKHKTTPTWKFWCLLLNLLWLWCAVEFTSLSMSSKNTRSIKQKQFVSNFRESHIYNMQTTNWTVRGIWSQG